MMITIVIYKHQQKQLIFKAVISEVSFLDLTWYQSQNSQVRYMSSSLQPCLGHWSGSKQQREDGVCWFLCRVGTKSRVRLRFDLLNVTKLFLLGLLF